MRNLWDMKVVCCLVVLSMGLCVTVSAMQTGCITGPSGDLNGDQVVDLADVLELLMQHQRSLPGPTPSTGTWSYRDAFLFSLGYGNGPGETCTPTPLWTPTETHTPEPTPTGTLFPTDTPTDTPTATETPTATPTDTPVPTNTPTDTPIPTDTPTDTPTDPPIPTNTPTETPTETPTPTDTPTDTPTGPKYVTSVEDVVGKFVITEVNRSSGRSGFPEFVEIANTSPYDYYLDNVYLADMCHRFLEREEGDTSISTSEDIFVFPSGTIFPRYSILVAIVDGALPDFGFASEGDLDALVYPDGNSPVLVFVNPPASGEPWALRYQGEPIPLLDRRSGRPGDDGGGNLSGDDDNISLCWRSELPSSGPFVTEPQDIIDGMGYTQDGAPPSCRIGWGPGIMDGNPGVQVDTTDEDRDRSIMRRFDGLGFFINHNKTDWEIPLVSGTSPGRIGLVLGSPRETWTPTHTPIGGAPTHTPTIVPVYGNVVINEFCVDAEGPDGITTDYNRDGIAEPSQDDFIEIYNNSDQPVDLTDWTISDVKQVRHTFAPGTILQPYSWIVVFGGGQPTGFTNAVTASSGGIALANNSDTILLSNNVGEPIDQVWYAETYRVEPSDGGSTARIFDGAAQWELRDPDQVTAGESNLLNPDATMTPFVTPTPVMAQLWINEFCANPRATCIPGTPIYGLPCALSGEVLFDYNRDGFGYTDQDEFVEIYNPNDFEVNLTDWTISEDIKIRHVFPPGTVIRPYGWFVVFGGGTPVRFDNAQVATSGGLGLSNTMDTITLSNNQGTTPDCWIDHILYSPAGDIQVAHGGVTARVKDGDGIWEVREPRHATQGWTNDLDPNNTPTATPIGGVPTFTPTPVPVFANIVINEFAADPRGGGITNDYNRDGVPDTEEDEFVELYNAESYAVDLEGWSLWDERRVRHVFGSGSIIEPGGFIVVFGGGHPDPEWFTNVQVSTAGGLGLGNTSDSIVLKNNIGVVIDTLDYYPGGAIEPANGGVTARVWDNADVWEVRAPEHETAGRTNVLFP